MAMGLPIAILKKVTRYDHLVIWNESINGTFGFLKAFPCLEVIEKGVSLYY